MTNWINANAIIQAGYRLDKAKSITRSLWQVGELYHAGAIGHAEFGRRNRALWDAAERHGCTRDVKRELLNAGTPEQYDMVRNA